MFDRRPVTRRWPIGAAGVLAAIALAGCSVGGEGGSDGALVERVVDGDTIHVTVDGAPDTVRLIGIDTPESVAPNQPVECFGPEASARLAEILPEGASIRIEGDPTQDERDRFDRLLGYVYPAGEERSANEALVASGHARVFVFDDVPFEHATAFMDRESEARDAGRGLWGACDGDAGAETSARPDTSAEPGAAPGSCDPNYSGCVPAWPPDVDCADLDGRVEVLGEDVHRLDGDGDGVACG